MFSYVLRLESYLYLRYLLFSSLTFVSNFCHLSCLVNEVNTYIEYTKIFPLSTTTVKQQKESKNVRSCGMRHAWLGQFKHLLRGGRSGSEILYHSFIVPLQAIDIVSQAPIPYKYYMPNKSSKLPTSISYNTI